MRLLIYAFSLMIVMAGLARGQEADQYVYLRRLMGVPTTTKITVAKQPEFTDKRPVKIFLALGFDGRTRSNFVKWLEKWNKSEGKKYGAFEVVQDISQSDIIAARYVHQVMSGRNSAGDPQRSAGTLAPTTSASVSYSLLIIGYIVKREADGFKVLRWYHDGASFTQVETNASLESDFDNLTQPVTDSKGKADLKEGGDILRDELFNLMKMNPASATAK